MSDDEWKRDAAFVLVMMAGSLFAGFCWGHDVAKAQLQQEAVDKGHAEYDRKTTEFRWINVVEDSK